MSYIRIAQPCELVSEVIKDAKEHGAFIYVNSTAKQTVITDSETMKGLEKWDVFHGYRIEDIYENN